MERPGRQRWERALVVLVLMLGVVAMHSLVMPMSAGEAMPMATVAAAVDPVPEIAASSADPAAGAMTHLCLAVLAALIVFALGAITCPVRIRRAGDHRPLLVRTAELWPRPPPTTAMRLARLCVIRT